MFLCFFVCVRVFACFFPFFFCVFFVLPLLLLLLLSLLLPAIDYHRRTTTTTHYALHNLATSQPHNLTTSQPQGVRPGEAVLLQPADQGREDALLEEQAGLPDAAGSALRQAHRGARERTLPYPTHHFTTRPLYRPTTFHLPLTTYHLPLTTYH